MSNLIRAFAGTLIMNDGFSNDILTDLDITSVTKIAWDSENIVGVGDICTGATSYSVERGVGFSTDLKDGVNFTNPYNPGSIAMWNGDLYSFIVGDDGMTWAKWVGFSNTLDYTVSGILGSTSCDFDADGNFCTLQGGIVGFNGWTIRRYIGFSNTLLDSFSDSEGVQFVNPVSGLTILDGDPVIYRRVIVGPNDRTIRYTGFTSVRKTELVGGAVTRDLTNDGAGGTLGGGPRSYGYVFG